MKRIWMLSALLAVLAAGCSQDPSSSAVVPSRSAPAAAPTFAAPVSYVGGNDPEAVTVADVNRDGSPDLLTANSFGDTVSIFLGRGDGSFGKARDFAVGTAPASIAAADLNGDGTTDIVTTNGGLAEGDSEAIAGSDDLSVLLGRGDGSFRTHVDYPAGNVPSGIAVVDVNEDGSPDLLTVDRHDSQLALLLGTGDGTFGRFHPLNVPDLALARRLTTADLNGDLHVDVLIPDESTSSVVVLPGKGDGTFGPPTAYPTSGTEPVAVAAGDLNGDGHPDLATANGYPAHDLSVLLTKDDGSYGPPTLYGTGFAPHSIVASDMNGDHIADLLTGNVGDSTVSLLVGKGDGTFGPAVDLPTGSTDGNNTMVVADLNADGKPDIVTANFKPSSLVTVLLQTVAG
jgi:hypothetical protein